MSAAATGSQRRRPQTRQTRSVSGHGLVTLYCYFNHISVRRFVPSGAPSSTPLRTYLRTSGSETSAIPCDRGDTKPGS